MSRRIPVSVRVRRRRVAASVVGVVAVTLLLVYATGGSSNRPQPHRQAARAAKKAPSIPAIEAGVLPWSLDQPLSREIVLPGTGSDVTVIGGLDPSGNSVAKIVSLDTATGVSSQIGSLAVGIHDAAGAQIAGRDLVLGGGSPNTVPYVESFASTSVTGPTTGSVIGRLPQPRSDSSAVTIGGTVYLLGGYDGANPDNQVLATTDGIHFSSVADIPIPVRYGAVAAVGKDIYLFGGQAVSGADSGQPVDAVQVVDTAKKSSKVIGHLPEALVGAAAAVINGHVYLAGGASEGANSAVGGTAPPSSSSQTSTAIFAFDPGTNEILNAGTLPVPVAYSAVQVVGDRAWLVGGEQGGAPISSVEMLTPNSAFGAAGAPGAGSPFFGDKLLVADRGNNRLLVLDDTNKIVWSYPSVFAAAPPGGFYFPDDAFFAKHGTEIVSNQEENETIVIIGYPSGQLVWQYGHPKQIGTATGYLHEPDDAYLLKNGQITVADADNCRILFINPDKTVANQIGTNDVCAHAPPKDVGSPNGDTPLLDGNVLVSEVTGQWITEYTPQGTPVWTVHLPIHYPSDPQQIGPDLYLVADYSDPGAIDEFNRAGQILYRYSPASGLGALDQPSLAEFLPSGVFMANDDYRDRMVAVDPVTQALVWQYGVPNTPGTAPGLLNIPDGFDLLLPDGSTPTHPATG